MSTSSADPSGAPRTEMRRRVDLRRLLCPIDFSDHYARAVRRGARSQDWYKAELWLLHAHHVLPMAPFAPEMEPAVLLTTEYRAEIAPSCSVNS